MSRKLRTSQVAKRLEELSKGWPEHLELFSWSGNLELIDHSKDPDDVPGSVFTASIVPTSLGGIKSDGGDPHQINNGEWPDPETLSHDPTDLDLR